jgi:hypothetical protein
MTPMERNSGEVVEGDVSAPLPAAAPWPDETILKPSAFVWLAQSHLHHDVTGQSHLIDQADVALLESLRREPSSIALLRSLFPDTNVNERITGLSSWGAVLPATVDESRVFVLRRIDIETCRQCNARCSYCPQSSLPKPRGVMPAEVFELVLRRLDPYEPEWVALNHYGEPLLDPLFPDRIAHLRARGLPVSLFTNATLLNDRLCDFLCEGGIAAITFNFPSLVPDEWSEFMHLPVRAFWKALHGIERILARWRESAQGLTIAVNGCTADRSRRLKEIEDHFRRRAPIRVHLVDSHSRAGAIENALVQLARHPAGHRYGGCKRIVTHLHVAYDARVFMCCQDYEQRVILGDLREESVASIMSHRPATDLRAETYGLRPMAAGRLCLNCAMLRTTPAMGFITEYHPPLS